MVAFPSILRRHDVPELLDSPQTVLSELHGNLADIRFINAWFGGTSILLRHLRPFIASNRTTSILDVATGSADIPLAVWRWASRHGFHVNITALDWSDEILSEARQLIGNAPIELVHGNAMLLPWHDSSFDVVTCCLALHHFPPDAATEVLREMYRIARTAVVVTDVRRSAPGYLASWLLTRTIARNVVTGHDGPLSVRHAYTPGELEDIASKAGLSPFQVHRNPLFRHALVAKKINDAG
ncbi:MAG: hypothetical protein NVSMB52_05070 [Chloroflexota bacterium]